MTQTPPVVQGELEGLDPAQVEASRAAHGSNRLAEIRGRSFLSLWLRALDDRTLKILLAGAALLLGIDVLSGGGFVDGPAILLAVAIASGVSAFNDWRAQAQFKGLQLEREGFRVRVIRAGVVQQVSAFDVVVGDVVELAPGDKLPADGRVVRGSDLLADESLLTGESAPVPKGPGGDAELRAGTLVVEGAGAMRATAVGERTEYGRLRAELATEQEPTPLQERLGRLADRISIFALAAAVLIFLALAGAAVLGGRLSLDLAGARVILGYVVLAVTVVVVAVPEGLPVAVTLSLAFSVRRMARENALVRRLMACETMGAADVLCADKTGTVTCNRMRVERLLVPGGEPGPVPAASEVPAGTREAFVEIASVGSTAHLARDSRGEATFLGSPTEGALLEVVAAWGDDYAERRRCADVLATSGFTSDRKRMSVRVRTADGERVYVKGAPEVVLPRCTRSLDADASRPLGPEERARLEAALRGFGDEALRPLALAYREVAPAAGAAEDPETDLVLVALVGIGDPVRPEARGAIEACRAAGLDVKLVTGDARATAEAVARRIGLLGPADRAVDGAELRSMSDRALREALPGLRVVARAVPSDKLRLVQALKESGRVVAVTGDGTNDGPALRHADVGLSMGLSGTDVAREASDVVLLDDNIATIVGAIRWGRAIFANIRKFIQFQLTVSGTALVTAFVAALAGLGTPLNVVQLLWVNLIMDALAALALGSEPPTDELLAARPHGRGEPLVTRGMWLHMAVTGAVMLAVLLPGLFTGILLPPADPAQPTLIFNVFVLLQLGNLLACRRVGLAGDPLQGLAGSRVFLAVLAGVAVVQVLVVQVGGGLFRTVPLGWSEWALSILLGALPLGASRLLRFVAGAVSAETWARAWAWAAATPGRARLTWERLQAPAAEGTRRLLAGAGALLLVLALAARSLGSGWAAPGFVLFAAAVLAALPWASGLRAAGRGGRGAIAVHAGATVALALALVAEVNYVSSRHHRRVDLTATRKFELSPQTREVLGRLVEPVQLTTIFRESGLGRDVRDLLAEYRAHGRDVDIRHLDPDRDPGEVERVAARIGLKNPSLSSVIVELSGRARVITDRELLVQPYEFSGGRRIRVRGAPARFRGEEAVSSALLALVAQEQPVACFAQGHGERGASDFGAEGLALARDLLRREGYAVEEVALLGAAQVPRRCTVLVQAGPRKALTEPERGRLSEYLAAGGKWLLTVEPWEAAGLEPLLATWGLEIRPLFLSDPAGGAAGTGPTTLVTSSYQDHPVTAPLAGIPLVFPYATSVRTQPAQRALQGANLVLTGPKTIGETDRRSREARFDEGKDRRGALSVASAVEEPPELYAADGRREPARIVVVGDTDFATNAHLHRGGGSDFFLNAVEWLARREELLGVRARQPDVRRVSLTRDGQTAIYWVALGLLPGIVGLLGAAVAFRRRR